MQGKLERKRGKGKSRKKRMENSTNDLEELGTENWNKKQIIERNGQTC